MTDQSEQPEPIALFGVPDIARDLAISSRRVRYAIEKLGISPRHQFGRQPVFDCVQVSCIKQAIDEIRAEDRGREIWRDYMTPFERGAWENPQNSWDVRQRVFAAAVARWALFDTDSVCQFGDAPPRVKLRLLVAEHGLPAGTLLRIHKPAADKYVEKEVGELITD